MSVNDYDDELYDRITDLVDELELEKGSDAFGVAMQVVHQGYRSLTPRQRALYDAKVAPLLERQAEERETKQILDSAEP